MNRLRILSVGMLVALSPPVLAAEANSHFAPPNVVISADSTLTLAKVVDAATRHVPEMAESGAVGAYAKAAESKSGAWLAAPPSLVLDYQSDAAYDDLGYRETEFGLELPIWRPSQKSAYNRLADSARETADLYPQYLRLIAAGRVRESLWEIRDMMAGVELARQQLQAARKLESNVRRMVELGDRPKADLVLASQDALGRQTALLDAEASLSESFLHYYHVAGLQRMPVEFMETASTAELSDQQPMLAASMQKVNRLRSAEVLARAEGAGQPSLRFNTRRQNNTDGTPDQDSAGIGLVLPFGGGAHSGLKHAEAVRATAVAEAELLRLRHELEAQMNKARIQLKAVLAGESLEQEKLTLAEKQYRLARLAYENGESGLMDLLRSQSLLFDAQRNYNRIQIRKGRAIASINQALGVTP